MSARAAAIPRDFGRSYARERWKMTSEAQWITFISASLLVFGLAVLYSASAIVAVNDGRPGTFYLFRQATGVVIGAVAFMVADKWREWAWPLMWFTLATLLLCLILPESIAPRVNGSKRFLYSTSFQPSEIGKFAVVVWSAMLVAKKGDQLRKLAKGLLPFFVVLAALCLLVAA